MKNNESSSLNFLFSPKGGNCFKIIQYWEQKIQRNDYFVLLFPFLWHRESNGDIFWTKINGKFTRDMHTWWSFSKKQCIFMATFSCLIFAEKNKFSFRNHYLVFVIKNNIKMFPCELYLVKCVCIHTHKFLFLFKPLYINSYLT